jgi:glucose-6-phosphate 1-dehydrogenase
MGGTQSDALVFFGATGDLVRLRSAPSITSRRRAAGSIPS